MDQRLLSWAYAAASRHRSPLPVLWLFTDSRRLPDPRAAASRLPKGRAGVVLRHDSDPARAALGRDLARICRRRRLTLVVAGDVQLARALRAGVHLRAGHWPSSLRTAHGPVTSSAHNGLELARARKAGADLAFLSPAFATASHPAARGLGSLRWNRLAARNPLEIAALGGIDGRSVRRLTARYCRAIGAIGALA